MHGKFGLLSLPKESGHSTALPNFLLVFLGVVFSLSHTTGCEAYSFTADGYGIFNVRTNLGPCRTHEEGRTRVDSEG